MRKGVIDLDLLDSEIEKKRKILDSPSITEEGVTFVLKILPVLMHIRSKCIPIEEPPVFLSKTCINQWESNRFCDKEGACEMCVNGKLK